MAPQPYDWQPRVEEQRYLERKLRSVPPPDWTPPAGDIQQARDLIRAEISAYLAMEHPSEMLLIKSSPGSGKTTLAVAAVDELAASGKRVAYAGPRHDLYSDVTDKSRFPSSWYEWLPRQFEEPQTCRYAAQIGAWLIRGYDAMDFCSGVCGWDYVKNGCPYHLQKRRTEPVIYIQHQHITVGHPLHFDVLFGDESPIQSFTREWRIPAQWVMPPGMDYTEPIASLLHVLAALCQTTTRPIQGPHLIEVLGGADEVIQACSGFFLPTDQVEATTAIHQPEEAGSKPYFHLFNLVPLLEREARLAKTGDPYPHRVIASPGHLTLLLRRKPDYNQLPEHIVWMDATARPEIYRQLFHRQVRIVDAAPRLHGKIYQVVDRANGKSTLEDAKQRDNRSRRDQAKKLVQAILSRHGYARPTVISYKNIIDEFENVDTAHFYAARGTNRHEDSDAVIVVGAPQPDVYSLVQTAKMIWFERDRAFDVVWCGREAAYHYIDPEDGLGRSYPVSGFWRDPDLQALLESTREDEIIQAAHRGRPINHVCDIWLLTNIPIDALPPDELLTMRQVMCAPEGVDIFKWTNVVEWLEGRDEVGVSDLEELGISRKTASAYLDRIAALPGWEKAARRDPTGGRPRKQARRTWVSRNHILKGGGFA